MKMQNRASRLVERPPASDGRPKRNDHAIAARSNSRHRCLALAVFAMVVFGDPAISDSNVFVGEWRGTWINSNFPVGRWASAQYPTGSILKASVFESGGSLYAKLYAPDLGVFDETAPALVADYEITVQWDESRTHYFKGTLLPDGSIEGIAQMPDPSASDQLVLLNWQASRPVDTVAGPPPTEPCDHDVPLYCVGSAEYCTELVQFTPSRGVGYLDYPVRDETQGNQYRSWVRRDLAQIVMFAAAELSCKSANWSFGNSAPLGIGDGSHEDGSTPTLHFTHENGRHIDIAYPQLHAGDNLLRRVGRFIPKPHPNNGTFLVGPPSNLDRLRSALLIAYLARHPNLEYAVADEEAGLLIESAFEELESSGWLEPGTRESLRFYYRKGDVTRGHADHMHITMKRLQPVIDSVTFLPVSIGSPSSDRVITAVIRPASGTDAASIDVAELVLLADGYTAVRADPDRAWLTDGNRDGIKELVVSFDLTQLADSLEPGSTKIAITGAAGDARFQASDTVSIK